MVASVAHTVKTKVSQKANFDVSTANDLELFDQKLHTNFHSNYYYYIMICKMILN